MPELLVTGASGHVGDAVVQCLTAAGVAFRRAEHSPGTDHPPADSLADMVRFDFRQPSTWPAAYDGIHTMYLMRPPKIGNVRRDLLPAVAAARDAGVQHVVFLSVQGADTNRIVPHATVEAWLRSSGLTWTFLRPSFFHQNLSTTHAGDIRDHNRIIVPAGTGATVFVDATDVGAVAAAALLDRSTHRNKAWTITGPRALTYVQVADITRSGSPNHRPCQGRRQHPRDVGSSTTAW